MKKLILALIILSFSFHALNCNKNSNEINDQSTITSEEIKINIKAKKILTKLINLSKKLKPGKKSILVLKKIEEYFKFLISNIDKITKKEAIAAMIILTLPGSYLYGRFINPNHLPHFLRNLFGLSTYTILEVKALQAEGALLGTCNFIKNNPFKTVGLLSGTMLTLITGTFFTTFSSGLGKELAGILIRSLLNIPA